MPLTEGIEIVFVKGLSITSSQYWQTGIKLLRVAIFTDDPWMLSIEIIIKGVYYLANLILYLNTKYLLVLV